MANALIEVMDWRLPQEVAEVIGKGLVLKLSVHRAKLLAELFPDRRDGAPVCLQRTGSGCGLALVHLAHAWELLSQAPVPEARRLSSLVLNDRVSD
jgi:hypothetical protein